MGVKILEKEEFTRHNGSGKMDMLASDIVGIIRNEYEYVEFTDFPYSEKTSITDIMRKVKRIVDYEFYRRKGKNPPENTDFIIMRRVKNEDGTVCVRAHFNVELWNIELNR